MVASLRYLDTSKLTAIGVWGASSLCRLAGGAHPLMNGSAPCQIHLAIVGATGMVGGYALRYALNHPSVGVVTVIGRSKLGISHPKLKEVLHQDFAVPILRSKSNAVKRGERVRTRKSASPESIRTLFNSFCAPEYFSLNLLVSCPYKRDVCR